MNEIYLKRSQVPKDEESVSHPICTDVKRSFQSLDLLTISITSHPGCFVVISSVEKVNGIKSTQSAVL